MLRNNNNGLQLEVGSTFESPTVLVACHIRGTLLFASEMRLGSEGTILDIPTKNFPSGVIHITLFNSNREPRCERLAYISSDDILDLRIMQDKIEYGKTEPV